MSSFAERYLVVPDYEARCDYCNEPMPAAARFALFGRVLGWSYYKYVWLCPRHRASRHVEARQSVDEAFRQIEDRIGAQAREFFDRALSRQFERDRARGEWTGSGESTSPDTPLPRSSQGAFSLVLVVAEESAFPLAVPLEQKLIRQIAAQPRFPLTSDARLITCRAPELPPENRAAVQGVVWSLQEKHGKRGGRWETEFYPTPDSVTFMVVYLE